MCEVTEDALCVGAIEADYEACDRMGRILGAALAEATPEVKCVLYRIAQEAVANAVRHASAQLVVLSVAARDGSVVLEVRDDGRGFDPRFAAERGHFGLAVMRERAGLVGGTLDLLTEPGRGTVVRVRVEAGRGADADDKVLLEGA